MSRTTAIAVARACGVLAAVLAAGCVPNSPTPPPQFSMTDLVVGTGDLAAEGDTLTVDYTLWLYDPIQPDQKGLVLDTSHVSETDFTFVLGAGEVILGWEGGLPGMRVGGLRRLVIPPHLAYGPRRNQAVPPNATLLFEVELLAVGEDDP